MRSLVLCLAVSCAAFSAWGTRMRPMTVEELAHRADAVVHGVIRRIETGRDSAGRIHTRTSVEVQDVWKGAGIAQRLAVVSGGGVLGERRVAAEGQAAFSIDEEVVLYLVRNPAGEWVTLGLGQGKFQVLEENGQRHVAHLFWGAGRQENRGPALRAPWRNAG